MTAINKFMKLYGIDRDPDAEAIGYVSVAWCSANAIDPEQLMERWRKTRDNLRKWRPELYGELEALRVTCRMIECEAGIAPKTETIHVSCSAREKWDWYSY